MRPIYQGFALRWMNGWAFGPDDLSNFCAEQNRPAGSAKRQPYLTSGSGLLYNMREQWASAESLLAVRATMKSRTKPRHDFPMRFNLQGRSVELHPLAAGDREHMVAFARALPEDDLLFLQRETSPSRPRWKRGS